MARKPAVTADAVTDPDGRTEVLTREGKSADYRGIFEQYMAGDSRGVLVLNSRRQVVQANETAREMLGFARDLPVLIGDILADVKAGFAVGDAIHDRSVTRHETFLSDPERILQLNIVPVIAAEGWVDHVVMTIDDVTRLRHLETVRRDFVANVSHELRTPLASINLLVETLQNCPPGTADAERFLRRIEVEALAMNRLVDELLQLSRLESGRVSLNVASIDMREVIEGVKTRLTAMADEKNLKLLSDVQQELPPARVDPTAVEQVLMNLVHNAIKFTPEGGTVTIRARLSHPAIEIEVVDTGAGMDSAEAARIFERFYKVDKGRSRETGTGLGLAIARHLLELHGAALHVVSERGQGSRFFFKLPIAE